MNITYSCQPTRKLRSFAGGLPRLLSALSVALTFTILPGPAAVQAQTPCAYPVPDMLYVVSIINMTTSEIWIIDPDTETVLCSSFVVGNSVDWIGDIAFHQNNPVPFDENSLYGVTHYSNDLVRVHPANWGISELNDEYIGAATMDSLAIGGDGFVYGTADDTINGSRLVQMDRYTGIGVIKGPLLKDAFGWPDVLSTGDLAFREDGVLFAAVNRANAENSWLVMVDRSTGAATLVGDIGHQQVTGLSFRHGLLYGVTRGGEILTIDPASGAGTELYALSFLLPPGLEGLSTHVKPGDANADGKVDGIDYAIWLNNIGRSTSMGRAEGDFNGDGVVDGVDYVIWLNNYGR